MKFILLTFAICFSLNSLAADFSKENLMAVLVANSGNVAVYMEQDNKEVFYKTLSLWDSLLLRLLELSDGQ